MSEDVVARLPRTRIPTGIPGLDRILGGGLFAGGIYVVTGHPGAGKTTFGNQVSFRHVAGGGRVTYVTLLSETHARMQLQIDTMSFYQAAAVGDGLIYLNGFSVIESDGLAGLLTMVRQAVRDHRADLLVLDGMVTAGMMARTGIDYKKFINELQTWMGVVGCTVLFLTSAGPELVGQPENSMVDGIFELSCRRNNLRALRTLSVAKFRGSAIVEGEHAYLITSDGIAVFPRLEGWPRVTPASQAATTEGMASIGDGALDQVLGGGLRRGTSTLLLGPPGSGKTIAGLQFLAAGLAAGEPAVSFGFVEPPEAILGRPGKLGTLLREGAGRGALSVVWRSPAETLPDQVGHDLLDLARRTGARRVFLDGLFGFRSGGNPERLGGLYEAVSHHLAALGATTVVSDEIAELPTPVAESLTSTVSAYADNILLLQNLDTGLETARLLMVLKTRQSGHDPRPQRYALDGEGLRLLPGGDSPELPVDPPPEGGARRRVAKRARQRRK